jgi:hypothetical protein
VHLGYFRWIGAFSPGVRPAALSDEFKNALEDREKINKNLLLFDIATGDDDKIVGDDVTKESKQTAPKRRDSNKPKSGNGGNRNGASDSASD